MTSRVSVACAALFGRVPFRQPLNRTIQRLVPDPNPDGLCHIHITGTHVRPGQNEILLDGAPNTVPGVGPGRGIMGVALPVEAVQECKVQTNGFSAEFGRSGGGLINMVTKTGTNELHGALFEDLRNSKLDA